MKHTCSQTIILCAGWYVIPWDMGILFKLPIIAVVSFPLIIILYELFVRRFNIVRFPNPHILGIFFLGV